MNKFIFVFVCIAILCNCTSSPSSSQSEEFITLSYEKIEVEDIRVFGKGYELYADIIDTYCIKYNNYAMDIYIPNIQELIDGNYKGYSNCIIIEHKRNNKQKFDYYIITAQYSIMTVVSFFSPVPLSGGISSSYSIEWDRRYSDGEREKQQAKTNHEVEWRRYFAGKANEARIKLELERRKIPESHILLDYAASAEILRLRTMALNENFYGERFYSP
jgi:hypothetical protein